MSKRKNLLGKKFSKWTVIEQTNSINHKSAWLCRCECGTEKAIRTETLTKTSKDCGCVRKKANDITGQRFGRWTVVAFSHFGGSRKHRFWICRCQCGTEKAIVDESLKNGDSKSCGCWKREWNRLPCGEAAMNVVRRNYTRTAKERGLVFELTTKQFKTITSSHCHYCGCPPIQKIEKVNNQKYAMNGNYLYNGIDRVDNNRGYTIDNCAPCCIVCNRAKHQMSEAEFFDWVTRVYERIKTTDIVSSAIELNSNP